MKVEIFLVGGFLEAGKTTLINGLLESSIFTYGKKTVVVCCEKGMEEYNESLLRDGRTILIDIIDKTELNRNFFKRIQREYSPERIIIEYNGTWELGEFLTIKLPRNIAVKKIISLADAATLHIYLNNMGNLMAEHFLNSDIIILNNISRLKSADIKALKRNLKQINNRAVIDAFDKKPCIKEFIRVFKGQKEAGIKAGVIPVLLALAIFFYVFCIVPETGVYKYLLPKLQSVNTVFLSILLQALPFILLGVFISSFLQVFISDDKFIRLFTKYQGIGYLLSILLGICLPVCDCAMAPITARMVYKGIPVHFVIIFLLAAPVVNPIVIVSTLYAFPEDYRVALFRLGLGIIVALLTGLIIKFLNIKRQNIIKDYLAGSVCTLNPVKIDNNSFFSRMNLLFTHAGIEFLKISKYVIIGALITSIIQSFISSGAFANISGTPLLPLIIMTVISVAMSVCSTSNAFIARSFSYSLPLYSVIFYMVMGPMLDLKNILMLSGSYKKKFLAEMVSIVCIIGIFVFSCGARYI